MKYVFFIFILFCFSCASNSTDPSECFKYPPKVEALDSRELYDSARWILFNWLGYKQIEGHYYGQLELRFKSTLARQDTLEIFFLFYFSPSLPSADTASTAVAQASVAFKTDIKTRLWAFVYPLEDFSDGLELGDRELDSPPSQKAIEFLHSHKDSLNICYREMARQLKFLK